MEPKANGSLCSDSCLYDVKRENCQGPATFKKKGLGSGLEIHGKERTSERKAMISLGFPWES
jgi:hypothetical protein